MLQALTIRDFVIVDKLDLEFSPGFTVLTGETGAGKSILVDALSLALGARGEGGITRNGCERAEVVASFDISKQAELQAWLKESELQSEDDVLVLRRVIYADGRTRAFINGMPTNVQQLREAGDFLIDIYSQHAHHSLLKTQYQRQVLDSYAGLSELARDVADCFHEWNSLHTKRIEMEKNAQAYAEELALLRDKVRELEQLALTQEDWESLQAEHHRLLHAAGLLEGGEACRMLLSEAEYAVMPQLSAIQHKLQDMVEFDAELREVLEMVDSAMVQLEESDRFLNRYLQGTEIDPERLHRVEQRVQAIHAASRKYRIRPEELPAVLQEAEERMAALEGLGDDEALYEREQEAWARYDDLAKQLSAGRKKGAERLGREITERMQTLALAGGCFEVSLESQSPSASGLDQVEFLVAGHAGVAPRPLAKVASGGELSRISLAIRVVTAQQGDIPTMIFDEVDVGIGGGVAEIVGQLLKELGERRQVLVITHLPQVAAQGVSHLRVSKSVVDGQTLSSIDTLDNAGRIDEVARMLGGVEITSTTRQHASELLGL